ncbi:MAG: hypothetical protein K0U74_08320 [Alphaproteobacteria bacterium]|nr:hypothetical protein [Alphaproteobacteria bacterium]
MTSSNQQASQLAASPVAQTAATPAAKQTAMAKASLVPVGLPASYIGGWAVAGIASLVYLSYAVNQPVNINAPQSLPVVQAAKKSVPPTVATTAAPRKQTPAGTNQATRPQPTSDPATAPGQLPSDLSLRTASRNTPTSGGQPTFSNAEPQARINTKYVTTQQILATKQPAAQPSPDSSATSRIVTGSISVPPPPERAPAPPVVTRMALKPAVKPATLRKPPPLKQAAARTPAAPSAPITFGPAVVKPTPAAAPAPSGLAILLATGSSVESLRLTWSILQERHAAALLDLSPRYIIKPNPQSPERKFSLLAGPVISANDVARVCGVLESEGMTCRTTNFRGNAL